MRRLRPFLGKYQSKYRLAGALFLGILLGIFILAFVSAGEIYDYQDSVDGVHLPEVDAIVCLAGGRGRIAAAGDIWYRYWELSRVPVRGSGKNPVPRNPPVFYISGMGPQATYKVLSHQLRPGVLEVLTPEGTVIENESSNTEENAEWLQRYAKQHAWEKILLITSRYHMKRARYIFGRLLITEKDPDLEIETLSVYQEPFGSNR